MVFFVFMMLNRKVLRQDTFIKKMYKLGWTRPSFFDHENDELVLQLAISRYHAFVFFHFLPPPSPCPTIYVPTIFFLILFFFFSFLDLMASSPTSFFVPTLDIDLVWHTHQLMSIKYESDCTTYVGRFIDQLSIFSIF